MKQKFYSEEPEILQYLGGNAGPTEESREASTDADAVSVGEVAVNGAGGGGCCSIESIVDMSFDTLFSSWLSCLQIGEIRFSYCNCKYRAQQKGRPKVA